MSEPTTSGASDPPPGESPFRAFADGEFLESDASRRLTSILATNGGAYAVSGARGAGKSWMMLKALADVDDAGGLTLWYPSPSSYSSFEFLSTLSDNFANQIERRYRPDRSAPTLASKPWRVGVGLLLVVGAFILAGTGSVGDELFRTTGLVLIGVGGLVVLAVLWKMRTRRPATASRPRVRDRVALSTPWGAKLRQAVDASRFVAPAIVGALAMALGFPMVWEGAFFGGPDLRLLVLAGAAFLGGYALLVVTVNAVARERSPEALLTREAGLLRERIRYSSTTTEGTEVGAQAGTGGIGGRMSTSRERELVERPTSVASLIHDFRLLAEHAAEVSHGKVVIAIDELDKIADTTAVRALLRDVKGIFDIRDVFFLISVSDEATRSLKLGGSAARDEFNSSFYSIIEVPPMDGAFRTAFFEKRNIPLESHVAASLSLLTGDNPRETLRLVDPILRCGGGDDLRTALSVAMWTEVRAFREQAMISSAPGLPSGMSDHARRCLGETLAFERFAPDRFEHTATTLINEWVPAWEDAYWSAHQRTPWRRLLVRLYVAAKLLEDHPNMPVLSEILRSLDESPVVARHALERLYRLKAPADSVASAPAGST